MGKVFSVMILGAGEAQVPVIKECQKLNYKSIVVDYDENAPGFKYADVKLFISTTNDVEILNMAKNHNIDGILTTSDFPTRIVAYVCESLTLKGLSVKAAHICTNKYLLRECLRTNGLATPKYLKLSTAEDLLQVENNLTFPLIVKPVDSSASRGVQKVINMDRLSGAFNEAKKFSICGDVIAEEFMKGKEYSVEALSQDGKHNIIAITEKETKGANDVYFVEDSHHIPANISQSIESQIKLLVLNTLEIIGLDNCATHTEVMATENGPVIVEIGARLGGDFITSHLVPLATGTNMLENVILIALNKKIKLDNTQSAYSGVQFVNSSNYNLITDHIEKIKNEPGYVTSEIKPYKTVDLKNSLDRLGYYICSSSTKEGLEKLLNYEQ